jgi:two-component system phosphate regulon sensor histidine kinase PhoR
MLTEIWQNLKFAKVYYSPLFTTSIIFFLLFIFFIDLSFYSIVLLLLIGVSLEIIALIILGGQRKREIDQLNRILLDITEDKLSSSRQIILSKSLKQVEKHLKSMFRRTQNDIATLKKLEQMRTEFLGNVSHELRTPIFAIQGYLETLEHGAIKDPKVNKNFILKAIHHTGILNSLLNDLIDISMIESGQMEMSYNHFLVSEFLNGIIAEYKTTAEEKGLQLILHPMRNDLELFGDRKRLKQVLDNLVLNAIKYTEDGSVEILVEETNNFGKIIVKDTGIGISSDDKLRIFERFYRVDKARSKSVGGTGLGLAIVKHIVEAHGSVIEVKSKLGKGSAFSFKLKK